MFQKYLIELEELDKRDIKYDVKRKGLKETIDYYLHLIDCTRIYPDGSRPNQTINYQYLTYISRLFYILDKSLNSQKPLITKEYYDETINKIKSIHENNLNFEKINPPIVYSKKNKTTKTPKDKADKPAVKRERQKKPTKAELKLAEKVSKLNKLTVNFKISEV